MPKLRWWWCGNSQEDGGCDCVSPQIFSDDGKQTLATGPFTSPTYEATQEEIAEQDEWAKKACATCGCEYFPASDQFHRDIQESKKP